MCIRDSTWPKGTPVMRLSAKCAFSICLEYVVLCGSIWWLWNFFNSLLTILCPAFLRKFVCQPLCCAPLEIQTSLSKSCPRRWIPCRLLTNPAVTSVVTNFQCHKLITEVNKYKNSDTEKFYLQSVWGKTRYFKHRKYYNLWKNNKARGD